MPIDDSLERLKKISDYFGNNTTLSPLFEPEFIASKSINEKLIQSDNLTVAIVTDVVDLINSVEKGDHHNGTGWLDYKMNLSQFLRHKGFEPEWKTH
jgi:hypothetical protein